MRAARAAAVAVALLLVLGVPWTGAGADGDGASSLKYQVVQKWTLDTPGEAFAPLPSRDGGFFFPIPHEKGEGFAAVIDGTALAVDTNGDGRPDTKVKGTAGAVTLTGRTADGRKLTAAFRLEKRGEAWFFAAGGVMAGSLRGTAVRLIDLNRNGRYDDLGEDAMIVGSGEAAWLLSRVVNLGGQLFETSVTPDGASITTAPFQGETGRIDVEAKFACFGTLRSAVLRDVAGKISFNAAGARGGIVVPAGEYTLVHGTAVKGAESVRIRAGGMKPITVASSATASPEWGAPLDVDFTFNLAGRKLTVPTQLRYHGRAGEEYYDFRPDGQPPKILVLDPARRDVALEGRFGGC